jgi:hypothetical protein
MGTGLCVLLSGAEDRATETKADETISDQMANCRRLRPYPSFDRHGRTNFFIADLYSEYFVLSICRSLHKSARNRSVW